MARGLIGAYYVEKDWRDPYQAETQGKLPLWFSGAGTGLSRRNTRAEKMRLFDMSQKGSRGNIGTTFWPENRQGGRCIKALSI